MAADRTDRPNVLLVVLDTARADHFGPFGGRARTPVFDGLASDGAAAKSFSTSPWTVPSHASMFSGLLPFDHGVTGAAAITEDRHLASLAPVIRRLEDRWLPERFRRAGYDTLAVSANVWITPAMGFDLGFDRFEPVGLARITPRGGERKRTARDLVPDPIRRRAKRAARYLRDARTGRDFGGLEAVRALKGAISTGLGTERPAFVFVNLMEAHAPYLPPDAFNPLTGRARLRAPALNHKYLGDEFVAAYNLGAADAPPEAIETLARLYAAEVEYVDHALGRVLESFGPVLDRTLVVVTADHGENLGEDHRLGHVLALDERLVEVPLVASGPNAEAVADRSRPVTSLAWLPGLIAGAAGLGDHPFEAPGPVAVAQYESGWNHLRRAADVGRHYTLSPEQQQAMRAVHRAATDGTTSLFQGPGGERQMGPPDGAAPLRTALDASAAGPAAGPPLEAGSYSPQEEAEIEERLRELGYL